MGSSICCEIEMQSSSSSLGQRFNDISWMCSVLQICVTTAVTFTFTSYYRRGRPFSCTRLLSVTLGLFIPLAVRAGQLVKWRCWLSPRQEQQDLTFGWAEMFKEAIQSLFHSVRTQWVIPIRDQLQLPLSSGRKARSKKTMHQEHRYERVDTKWWIQCRSMCIAGTPAQL